MQSAPLGNLPAGMPLSFPQAVQRVTQGKGAAFAFCPYTNEAAGRANGPFTGASIYVLIYCREHGSRASAHPEYWMHYIGGRYGNATPPRERYRPEQVPREAKQATYRLLPELNETLLRGELQAVHRVLQILADACERDEIGRTRA